VKIPQRLTEPRFVTNHLFEGAGSECGRERTHLALKLGCSPADTFRLAQG
jgi:hypothetical protein